VEVKDSIEALPVSVEEDLWIAASSPHVAVTQTPDFLRITKPAVFSSQRL
jgi:hypothetical protein